MKTITFYSYKGGVGRSLALANIAERLSEFGKKVCLLDFDLEAPGLHYKFSKGGNLQINRGIVDYIHDFTNNGILADNIIDYTINLPRKNNNSIVLIPAGNTDSKEYWKKLSSIDLYELLYENENGLSFLLDLKEKIKREINPDFLLIDSRTGVSEISGITLTLLADDIVIIAANNRENILGTKRIIAGIKDNENRLFNRNQKLTFVLSRVPFTEKPEDKNRELILTNRIKRELLEVGIENINVIHSDRELEENEVLKIGYEKDEQSTSQISRDYLKLFEKIAHDYLSEVEVKRFAAFKESEKLLEKAIQVETFEEKLSLINQALNINNTNLDFLSFRANLYTSTYRFDDAINDYTIALTIAKDNYWSLEAIAQLLIYKEDYQSCISHCLQALKIYKEDIFLLTHLAYCYSLTNRIEAAIEIYSRLIAKNPDNNSLYNSRANCNKELLKYEEAYKDIYKSLQLNPNYPIAYATLAEINAMTGKVDEFYLALELAFQKELEIKKIASVSKEFNRMNSLEIAIAKEKVYKNFLNEDRFLSLLDKYAIDSSIFK